MRRGIRSGAFGLGCAGLAVLTLVTPAAGERSVPDRGCAGGCSMPGGDSAGDCEGAAMSTPPGGSGDVKLTADVADGASVAPGQDILLRLQWDPTRWSGPQLDRALDCVRVKGEPAPDLSGEEAPTANDGVFEYRLHVPDDIRPGCDICVQGYLAGEAAGGGSQQVRSDRHCFMSGSPAPAGPPAPPAPPAKTPSAPPAPAKSPSAPPAPAKSLSPPPPPRPTTAGAPARLPTEVAGVTASRPAASPAPAPAPTVAAAPELPRTGSAASRTGTAGGGLALSLGGLAVMGGAGRRKRRQTGS